MPTSKLKGLMNSLNPDELNTLYDYNVRIITIVNTLAYNRKVIKQHSTCKKVNSYRLFNARYMIVTYGYD